MIAQWMLYCAVVGVLLCAGAAAAEGALRSFGRATRWAWAAAIVLTLAIPAAARWLPRAPQPLPERVATADAGGPAAQSRIPAAAAVKAPRRIDLAALDRPLALAWLGSSTAAVLALLAACVVLERRRRQWRAAEVDGVPVLLSPRTGPAVVGLIRSRIVLPEWVVRDAEPGVRALLLEHEREHLRAGDPRLLSLALGAAALMPWNPAAWWQLRRLRLAVEVDCDARVLARRGDVRGYGALLLEVGRRASSAERLITAAAFSEPTSFLERRIRIMTQPRVRAPLVRAAGFGAAAIALAVAACETPGPVQPSPVSVSMQSARKEASTGAVAMRSSVRISRAAIEAAVREHYPDVFRAAATDEAHLLFVLDPAGKVVRHERLQERRPAPEAYMDVRVVPGEGDPLDRRRVDPAEAIDVVTFAPGQMGPGQVEVVWIRNLSEEEMRATRVATRERVPAGTQPKREMTSLERQMADEQAVTQGARERRRSPEGAEPRTEGRVRQPGAFRSGGQREGARPQVMGELVARYLPRVAADGTTADFVWFLVDADGRMLHYGDGRDTRQLNARTPEEFAVIEVYEGADVVLNGHEIPVVWARLKA
ncbi:MAG TPA: M56 family metallopeptidase [Longimicrobium sp.]|nr:M56 family metallopeptidase [Longimicrobium sp.]